MSTAALHPQTEIRVDPRQSAGKKFLWCVRREFWENRSLYIAPLAVAGVSLVSFFLWISRLPGHLRSALALDVVHQHAVVDQPYEMVAGAMMLTGMLVGAFYSIDALYGERRDRSILYWKSLPVSDVTTVLSKASIPIFILPLIIFAFTAGVQWIMMLVSYIVARANGVNPEALWTVSSFFQMSLMLLYHLVFVHGLWHSPFYAWLLMVSSWTRRAPFLWAVVPLVAISTIERIVFNTGYLTNLLGYYLMGGGGNSNSGQTAKTMSGLLGNFEPIRMLSVPGLWLGLAATGLFLYAAIRLRRAHGPI